MVCLIAAPWIQLSVSAGNGWPHNALRHHWLMPISCHFRDCKTLLVMSLTHVSGAITSVLTFTFTFTGVKIKRHINNCTLVIAARCCAYAVVRCLAAAWVSVCLSVMFMYCVETVKDTATCRCYGMQIRNRTQAFKCWHFQ